MCIVLPIQRLMKTHADFVIKYTYVIQIVLILDIYCRSQSFYYIEFFPMFDIHYGLMESFSLLWIHINFLRGTFHSLVASGFYEYNHRGFPLV